MLVYLDIPNGSVGAYAAFAAALGADAVGWVGRNLEIADLESRSTVEHFKVVGGPITLSQAARLTPVKSFVALLTSPAERVMGEWSRALADPDHRFHPAANTFTLREIFEEAHPFADALSNAETRALSPPNAPTPNANAALRTIKGRRFIIGDTAQLKPFVGLLCRMLNLPAGALDEAAFRPKPSHKARGELLKLIEMANQDDIALALSLKELRKGKGRIVRTTGGGANPNRAGAKPSRAPDKAEESGG